MTSLSEGELISSHAKNTLLELEDGAPEKGRDYTEKPSYVSPTVLKGINL